MSITSVAHAPCEQGRSGGAAASPVAAPTKLEEVTSQVSIQALEQMRAVREKQAVMAEVNELRASGQNEKATEVFCDWQRRRFLGNAAGFVLAGDYDQALPLLLGVLPKSDVLPPPYDKYFCDICSVYFNRQAQALSYNLDLVLPYLRYLDISIEDKVQILLNVALVATEKGRREKVATFLIEAKKLGPERFEELGDISQAVIPDGAFRGKELIKDLRPWLFGLAQDFENRRECDLAAAIYQILPLVHKDTQHRADYRRDLLQQMLLMEGLLDQRECTGVIAPMPTPALVQALEQPCPFNPTKLVRETHHCMPIYDMDRTDGPGWILIANNCKIEDLPKGYKAAVGGEILCARRLAGQSSGRRKAHELMIFSGKSAPVKNKGRVFPVLRFFP